MKRYLLLAGVGFCCVSGAALAAFDCATPPSCDELGYAYEEIDCDGQTTLKCPFDDAKVYCPNPASPAEKCIAEGYSTDPCVEVDKTCPYDEAYHTCKPLEVKTCDDIPGAFTNLLNCDCSIGYIQVKGFDNCYRCATEIECPMKNGIKTCPACPNKNSNGLLDDDVNDDNDDNDVNDNNNDNNKNPGSGGNCPPGGCTQQEANSGTKQPGEGVPTGIFKQP